MVSRIARLVETWGVGEDGAGLAEEYAEKVQALGKRMDAVEAALKENQYGEAVRLMEEKPRLLDEVGVLDFHQFGPWKGLCAEKRWASPPAVDGAAVERILATYEGSATMDGLLKQYRKAVRTRDTALAVRSLRRVTSRPEGAEWKDDLTRLEGEWQEQLGKEFNEAVGRGDDAAAGEAAGLLLGGGWTTEVPSAIAGAAQAWKAKKDAAERQRQLDEDVALLERMSGERWERLAAEQIANHAKRLTEEGGTVTAEGAERIRRTLERCGKEAKEEETRERKTSLEKAMREAVEARDAERARELMESGEFRALSPDEELSKACGQLVEESEIWRRRRMMSIGAGLLALLVAASAGTWWLYETKQRNRRCAEACAALERAATGPRAHEALEKALRNLESGDPKVREMEGVRAYEKRLAGLVAARAARLSQAEEHLSALETASGAGWTGMEDEEAERRLEALKGLLADEDSTLEERMAQAERSLRNDQERRREERRQEGTVALAELEKREKELSRQCKAEYIGEELAAAADGWFRDAEAWDGTYGEVAAAEGATLAAMKTDLEAARKQSRDAKVAVERLAAAATGKETAAAREALRTHYRGYPGVEAMGDLEVTAADVGAVEEGKSPGQLRVKNMPPKWPSEAQWRHLVEGGILNLGKNPAQSSLYGIDRGDQYEAVSIGKCRVSAPGSMVQVRGELISLMDGESSNEINYAPRTPLRSYARLLPPCYELQDVLDVCQDPDLTRNRLSEVLWKHIKNHIEAGHGPAVPPFGGDDYRTAEGRGLALRGERYPAYKRVQMMDMYFGWLREAGLLDAIGREQLVLVHEYAKLAQPLHLGEDIPSEVAWVFQQHRRVVERNRECADLLWKTPTNFTDRCRAAIQERESVQRIGRWEFGYAGKFRFDPGNPGRCVPEVVSGISPDHPLYVLRKREGRIVAKAILWPTKSGGWGRKGEDWKAGEPFFQIVAGGKADFASERLAGILKRVSKETRDEFEKTGYIVEVAE